MRTRLHWAQCSCKGLASGGKGCCLGKRMGRPFDGVDAALAGS